MLNHACTLIVNPRSGGQAAGGGGGWGCVRKEEWLHGEMGSMPLVWEKCPFEGSHNCLRGTGALWYMKRFLLTWQAVLPFIWWPCILCRADVRSLDSWISRRFHWSVSLKIADKKFSLTLILSNGLNISW